MLLFTISAFEITTDALSGRACKFSFWCSDAVEPKPLLVMCVSSLPARQYKHYTIVNMIIVITFVDAFTETL